MASRTASAIFRSPPAWNTPHRTAPFRPHGRIDRALWPLHGCALRKSEPSSAFRHRTPNPLPLGSRCRSHRLHRQRRPRRNGTPEASTGASGKRERPESVRTGGLRVQPPEPPHPSGVAGQPRSPPLSAPTSPPPRPPRPPAPARRGDHRSTTAPLPPHRPPRQVKASAETARIGRRYPLPPGTDRPTDRRSHSPGARIGRTESLIAPDPALTATTPLRTLFRIDTASQYGFNERP